MQCYSAKLSDFGLAKDGPRGDQTHVSTRVMGTYGYAAPEYVMTGPSFLFPITISLASKLVKRSSVLRIVLKKPMMICSYFVTTL